MGSDLPLSSIKSIPNSFVGENSLLLIDEGTGLLSLGKQGSLRSFLHFYNHRYVSHVIFSRQGLSLQLQIFLWGYGHVLPSTKSMFEPEYIHGVKGMLLYPHF